MPTSPVVIVRRSFAVVRGRASRVAAVGIAAGVALTGCASDDQADAVALGATSSPDVAPRLAGAGDPIGQELFTSYLASIGTSEETLATVGDAGE